MVYVTPLTYETASPKAQAAFDDQIKQHGRITNMKKTLLHSVPAFEALMTWYPLQREVAALIGERATNFYCYAISTTNECLICSMFFKKILDDLAIDFSTFAFTDEENDLIAYGKTLVADAANIPPALVARLRSRYSTETFVLLTAFGSMMIATNLINTALQVELDEVLLPYTKRG